MTNIDNYLQQVDNKIYEVFDKSPKVIRPVMEDLKSAKGKFIRAKVVIATALAFNNKEVKENVINIAAAIELLHLATLVHDDIIDDAPTRRGKQSVQSKYGKRKAVIAGDYLFTKCYEIIGKSKNVNTEYFSSVIASLCIGEALQLENNMNFDIDFSTYRQIISGKTAGLFMLCTYATAIELEQDKRVSERLGRAGYYMGLVFQMIDDCLDYEGTNEVVEKQINKDLKEGVITYPLIYTLAKNPDLKPILKNNFSVENIKFVINEVNTLGGIRATKEQAEEYYKLSKKFIEKSVGTENGKFLIEYLDSAYNRKK